MIRCITWLLAASFSVAAAQSPPSASAKDTGRRGYTAADVRFMSGMIYHHAQAVVIAGWAPSHGASPSVRTLCERIVVSQNDEIAFLRRWLADHHEAVPAPHPEHLLHDMDSTHMMPGMLTAEQLGQLDRARGPDFDALFLRLMIQHHEGAITMVNALFAAGGGAGEDNTVYKFATDVFADQTTEIERMQRMLAAEMFATPSQR